MGNFNKGQDAVIFSSALEVVTVVCKRERGKELCSQAYLQVNWQDVL